MLSKVASWWPLVLCGPVFAVIKYCWSKVLQWWLHFCRQTCFNLKFFMLVANDCIVENKVANYPRNLMCSNMPYRSFSKAQKLKANIVNKLPGRCFMFYHLKHLLFLFQDTHSITISPPQLFWKHLFYGNKQKSCEVWELLALLVHRASCHLWPEGFTCCKKIMWIFFLRNRLN